jgi:hypothetical protein
MALKKVTEIPTIDVNLVTIKAKDDATEYALDTASEIETDTQIEETDAVKLVVKGVLKAQKPKTATLTGHKIKLKDNVFTPELVKILQGGTITMDTGNPKKVLKYEPPKVGEVVKLPPFTLCAYSAIYNAAGQVTGYEKISYPNCKGEPISFNSEDGKFRTPEYTIYSAPDTGQAPYTIEFVDALPQIS